MVAPYVETDTRGSGPEPPSCSLPVVRRDGSERMTFGASRPCSTASAVVFSARRSADRIVEETASRFLRAFDGHLAEPVRAAGGDEYPVRNGSEDEHLARLVRAVDPRLFEQDFLLHDWLETQRVARAMKLFVHVTASSTLSMTSRPSAASA